MVLMNVSIKRMIWIGLGLMLFMTGPTSANELRKEWPNEETAVQAVRKVFDLSHLRPLEASSFDPLRPCFSVKQQRNVDAFFKAFGRLVAKRDRVAGQAGIRDSRWWPSDVALDLHLILKGDPLTNRAGLPDKFSIGEPRRVNNGLELVATETYIETAQDGSDLGGIKTCHVKLLPEKDKWTIDEIVFKTQQYGRDRETTLSKILQGDCKRLRELEERIKDFTYDVRRPRPVRPTNNR
jgi:hypothetical protein